MATPTAPTATTLVTEAFIRSKIPIPGTPEVTRAEDFLLIEILKIIAKSQHWKVLEETSTTVLDAFVPRYAMPADYNKTIEATLLKANFTGTAQSATAGGIVLDASDAITQEQAEGAIIIPTSGSGKSEIRRITSYNFATKAAIVTPDWTNTPGTDPYMVLTSIDNEIDLPHVRESKLKMFSVPGEPENIDVYNNEIYITPTPDDVTSYAVMVQHQLDIAQIDLSSSRITDIYTSWEPVIVQGVIALIYQSRDDDRYEKAFEKFTVLLALHTAENTQMSPVEKERIRA